MHYPAYPAYKDSGVAWLGDVPLHWGLSSVRKQFSIQLGKMLQNDASSEVDLHVTYLRAMHVNWERVSTDSLPRMWASPKELEQYGVQAGDLLVCEGGEAGRAGMLQQIEQPCIIQNALHRIRSPHPQSLMFLLYLLQAAASSGWLDVICNKATITHFTGDKLGRLTFPLAPLPEQAAIAAFLDRETAKIAALIARQERMIALLAEKRQALIAHAVTKGLRADAPMKDSGVAWLGEIPAHWETPRLKHVASVQTGLAKGKDYADRATVAMPYMRVANVQDGYLDLSDIANITVLESEIERYSLRRGDILMNEGGDNDKLGRGAVWEGKIEPCLHQNHVFAVRPHERNDACWLSMLTQASYGKFFFFSRANQSTNLASISQSNLRELPVLMPPKEEREEILAFIKCNKQRIDALIAKAQQAIALMREHRTSLIAAAVTGKIDVRGVVVIAGAASEAEAGRLAGVAR